MLAGAFSGDCVLALAHWLTKDCRVQNLIQSVDIPDFTVDFDARHILLIIVLPASEQ